MRTVDQILHDTNSQGTPPDAESKRSLDRYSRQRHIETVRSLSKVNGFETTLYLVLQWLVIIGTMVVAAKMDHLLVYFGAVFVIASRLQTLGVMMHDGTHYLLYKNRFLNDVISDLFIAFPIGMSTTLYRKTHFRHHRHANTDQDPDLAAQQEEKEWYEWPKTRLGVFFTFLRTVFGFNFTRGWILYKHWVPWNNFTSPDFPRRCRVSYIISMILVYSFFAWALKVDPRTTLKLMAVYLVAGITVLNFVNRVRTTSEHIGTLGDHELNDTRTVLANWIERFFIAPYGINFHLEHHLFPSVPGYRLAKLHRELMKDEDYRSRAHITRGYVGVLRELNPSNQDREGDEER